jgi:GT2 family glycosyltransferase
MLDECLMALSRSTMGPLECLVVDDASTEGVYSVAERHGARVIALDHNAGPARARNIGAAHARGELLLFLDADVCIHSDAIARILDHFRREPSLDAVIGAYDDSPSAQTAVSQYRNLLHCYTHRAGRRDAATFWAGCGAIRKAAFSRSGGFDDGYGRPAVEDIELGLRLKAAGGRILLDPEIQVTHLKRWTFMRMVRTDIFDRGVPWTRLILRSGFMPDDLNLRRSQRLSVLAVFLLILAVCFRAEWAALACALLCALLNVRFYSFLAARRGWRFLLKAVPLDFLFHLYSGFAFLLGTGLHLFSGVKASFSAIAGEETP